MATRTTARKAVQQKANARPPKNLVSWTMSLRLRIVILVCIVALFACLRFRLRQMPLERDEGEYAYAGQLILQGVPPYTLAYNMKLPGTYVWYAVMLALFGQTPGGIHIGLLLVNSATIVLTYRVAAKLLGYFAGLISTATYGLLSTTSSVSGLAGHATHFVVLAAVAGLLLLLRALETKRWWLFLGSGLLFGLAFVMKQPGIMFCVFAILCVIWSDWSVPDRWKSLVRHLGPLLSGIALPYALTAFLLWRLGVFEKFWFWTFSYALKYGTSHGLKAGMHDFLQTFPGVTEHFVPVWIIAGVGATAFWWYGPVRRHRSFVLVFLAFSILAVCPGLYFREHYFILLLPALSILVGAAVSSASALLAAKWGSEFLGALPCLFFITLFVWALISQSDVLFDDDPVEAVERTYSGQPFVEATVFGDYLRNNSDPSAKVGVLGSEPEIYFYAHRHSATGYIYTYPLMEEQPYALTMQNEMIAEIEASRPEFVVLVQSPTSWLRHPESDDHIFDWMSKYVRREYEVIGIADRQSDDHTEYRWNGEATSYQPHGFAMYLFRRRAGS